MMTNAITNYYEFPQCADKDPDALVPPVKDGSQSVVKVKPVTSPRPRLKHNAQFNTINNTADSIDTTSNTTKMRPPPARPPRPPMSHYMTSSKPAAAVDGGNLYVNTVKATDSTDRPALLPRPRQSSLSPSTSVCETSPPQTIDRTDRPAVLPRPRQSSLSPSTSVCETSPPQATDSTDRPAVLPRPRQSSLSPSTSVCETSPPQTTYRPAVLPRPRLSSLSPSTSVCETSTPQSRPPPPQFNPPPPPSMGSPLEPLYIEIPTYLEILPAVTDKKQERSALPSGQPNQSACSTSHQQTTEDTEDINGRLTWLRVSKSDFMTPSLYGLSIDEEIRSFIQRAMNVRKAMHLYNLLMIKRNGGLQDIITEFISISDSVDKMKKKNKNMGIAGGTTGAVGGVAAVVGIVLAPMTLGASLIATAVGAGMVASAGGIGAHTVIANKKTVDRMTVEKLVGEYKANIIDMEHCLDFILSGMNELRRHNIPRLQRAGAPPDALKMAHLSQSVFSMNHDTSHAGGVSSEKLIQAFAKEMDQYFSENDGQKLKKSNKSRFSSRVRLLAENLQDELDHLNQMWKMFG